MFFVLYIKTHLIFQPSQFPYIYILTRYIPSLRLRRNLAPPHLLAPSCTSWNMIILFEARAAFPPFIRLFDVKTESIHARKATFIRRKLSVRFAPVGERHRHRDTHILYTYIYIYQLEHPNPLSPRRTRTVSDHPHSARRIPYRTFSVGSKPDEEHAFENSRRRLCIYI